MEVAARGFNILYRGKPVNPKDPSENVCITILPV